MHSLYKYFFRGLITVLPLALTIYLLYIFLAWTEAVALTFLRPFIGGFYVPGMGLALGILGILAIGCPGVQERVPQRDADAVEMPFTNLPGWSRDDSSLKSFADYFSPSPEHGAAGGDPCGSRTIPAAGASSALASRGATWDGAARGLLAGRPAWPVHYRPLAT